MRKTRRAAGAACVTAVSLRLERIYTTDLSYAAAPDDAVLAAACDPDALKYYSISKVVDAKTYTVTGTPIGAHSGDSCGDLTLNQLGVKSPATGCW
ncbi:type IV pilin protein [Stenotrophomonas sp. SY1]|nr:type IV pilin protein [Stenotrophomonas sp. SY1]